MPAEIKFNPTTKATIVRATFIAPPEVSSSGVTKPMIETILLNRAKAECALALKSVQEAWVAAALLAQAAAEKAAIDAATTAKIAAVTSDV